MDVSSIPIPEFPLGFCNALVAKDGMPIAIDLGGMARRCGYRQVQRKLWPRNGLAPCPRAPLSMPTPAPTYLNLKLSNHQGCKYGRHRPLERSQVSEQASERGRGPMPVFFTLSTRGGHLFGGSPLGGSNWAAKNVTARRAATQPGHRLAARARITNHKGSIARRGSLICNLRRAGWSRLGPGYRSERTSHSIRDTP